MSHVTIRRASAGDAETLIALVRGLAEYERLEPPDDAACVRLVEHGFGDRPRFETYLAELDGEAVGFATIFETYSTFAARPTLYLEDLFVRPEARRRGAGTALLRHLAKEAIQRGCGRMEWAGGVGLERAGPGRLPPRRRRAARRLASLPRDGRGAAASGGRVTP